MAKDHWEIERLKKAKKLSKELLKIDTDTWLSQDTETKLWYLIIVAKQEYRENKFIYSYEGTQAIYKKRIEPIFGSQPTPSSCQLPILKGMYVKGCKSASSKTIKKFIKN